MIDRILVRDFRKLKNVEIELDKGITAISGTNGTCKTSLLHLIGNSYQKVPSKIDLLKPGAEDCMTIIRQINASVNPKVEVLTRDANNYAEDAKRIKGTIYTVDYSSAPPLSFRKHVTNNEKGGRFYLKPIYSSQKRESLPYEPVIYLSLTRLFPFGEFLQEDQIKKRNKKLPIEHEMALIENFSRLSHIDIENPQPQKMGDIKTRHSFSSNQEGVDSNTISAGEDNLFIILLALESLAYYCESLINPDQNGATLLIDELDATLHPSLQVKLINLFMEYCERWPIQIVFTTHSLSLLEHLFAKKQRVVYLLDNISNVIAMPNPDIFKIKMYLKDKIHKDIYLDKVVPVFTEDEEARFILEILLNKLKDVSEGFSRISRSVHLVDVNIGSDVLRKLFSDTAMRASTLASICILDGDQTAKLESNIICLPGSASPEEFLCEYCEFLYEKDDEFWIDETLLDLGFTKHYYLNRVRARVKEIDQKIKELEEKKVSTKGIRREKMKALFNDNLEFFSYVFKRWIHNEENSDQLKTFFDNFHKMFLKIAPYQGIDGAAWSKNDEIDLSVLYLED